MIGSKDINKLTFEERDLLHTLSEFESLGNKEIKKEKRILPIEEWLDSEFYSGDVGKLLYPYWKKHLIDVFNNQKINYNELIITGALSSGKTYFSEVCWLRLLYIFSQTENLQESLGLSPHSKIIFAYLSVSITEAELTGFGEFRTLIDSIPYFQQLYPRNPNLNSRLEFPNGVSIICGSGVLHFIGTHLFSLIFDETNFTKTGGGKPGDLEKAFDIYEKSTLRIRTRYSGKDVKYKGLNILVSSSTHKTSFTEQAIKLAKKNNKSKVVISNLIDTKPEGTFSDEKFLFFLGDENQSPKIIDNKEDLLSLPYLNNLELVSVKEGYESLPGQDKKRFTFVPEDFRKECKLFPEGALRDILGYSQSVSGDLLDTKEYFYKCIEEGKSFGLRHPFKKEVLSIGIKDKYNIIDFLDKDYFLNITKGRRCYIHIDQSGGIKDSTGNKLDATGIGMAMIVEELNQPSKITVPLMLKIEVPIGDKISISKCRQFIEDLVNLGINIENVSYDSYGSVDAIQILESKGIKAGRFSADKNDECWLKFIDLIYNLEILLYDYPLFEEELFALKHDRVNRKVDHGLTGSKDICDGVISSVYQLWLKNQAFSNDNDKAASLNQILLRMKNIRGKEDLSENLFGEKYSVKTGRLHKNMEPVRGMISKL